MQSYEEYESEYEREARHRPHCECCKEPIWDDAFFETDDYAQVCENCFEEWIEELRTERKHYFG